MKIASLNLLAFVGLFSACTLANPDGFLSINCGASNNDTNGEFEWITDSLFIKFRNTFIRPPFTFSNIAYQYQSVAYFTNMEAKKYCYLLPVRPHIQYLVRVRFVLKGFENLRLASVFDLYIEGIKWAKVDLANFPNSLYAYCEIILTPKRDSMSLCLARNSETQESYYVFISTIELRPLQSQMYSTYTDFNYSALSLFSRINFGSFDEIKFPQDQYDRMWQTFQVPLTTNISTNDSSFRSVKNQQPESVLKTAITSQVGEELLISNWFNVVPGIYYFALYLCNINKTSLSGNNTFQVFIGNVQIAETEVPEYMYCLSPERRLQLSTTDSIDIRIGPQEGSEMRPFINAAEAYQILNITNMTQAGDVLAIRQIAETANVPDDWTTGDPCLPADLPLTGVMCNEEDPPRVTTVNLTNRGLTGNIPPSIANLTGLKRLLLGNNNFSGAIPDLSTLKNLTTLQLQNNQLTGNIPSSLEKLPVLNELINPQRKSTQEKKSKENGLIIGLAIGCFVLLVVVIFGIRLWRQKYNQGNLTSSSTMQPQHSLTDNEFQKLVVEYSEEDIKAATNNYSTIIGKGGFGSVFYGKLSGNDVAVKILSTNSSQGKQEFRNEVTLLSRVHHKNLVNLIGYCRQPIVALVYEFMECGTLMDHLHGSAKQEKPLDWQTRINIALQAAQGLLYLHEGCSPPIIHRDVKCSNILLDKRMFAKITDFGLSKLLDNAKSYITTNVKGTLGYLDPEYFGKSSLNEKSDVYSFGVVLLEIISGVPPKEGLVELAKELLNCGRLADLVDSSLGGRYSVESARKVTNIAYACVEAKSINRPTMNIVVKELAEAKELLFDDSGESANVASSNVLDEMPEAR
ncbi:leucine-rich repeat receptor-like serine/threonine-protein kinase At2g14510 isoform X2 [Cryptomeria japonica]|uniref:leucine-rich repeat receptor-like serine/threonine-protein kinase At2g14510 isoform X2 n=1 Tax=Cryptomeria japonica TaxID=3369 RepID=UPI0027DA2680|nr:leucine-rich repeat receptor-like serine/threonine-protein kinase At2g14510 isoform X2 [Cryptomeria japonica]